MICATAQDLTEAATFSIMGNISAVRSVHQKGETTVNHVLQETFVKENFASIELNNEVQGF
uniref:Uncharacterized protein n=1 Tax=Pristionchus pacificus TaxID=54126 RepID=A0A2A6BGF6_PRIPA|eukprot:PDM64938.1 hypothetical protein PRIPAC_53194 [Pristionchus pacificus]